jgi:hypothetical protein
MSEAISGTVLEKVQDIASLIRATKAAGNYFRDFMSRAIGCRITSRGVIA